MIHRHLLPLLLICLHIANISHANTTTTTCSSGFDCPVEDEELLGEDIFEIFVTILFKTDSLDRKLSISKYTYNSLVARTAFPPFGERYIHSYDDPRDMIDAGGPGVDHEQCLKELGELGARVERFNSERLQSKDLNIKLLLDTWGKQPSGVLLGNYLWPGMYAECQRLKIRTLDDRELETRYCIAQLKYQDWPKDDVPHNIEIGICLPRVCDSVDYKNKYNLIENLVQLDQSLPANLTQLYCLPDKRSRLQTWWTSPQTATFVGLLGIWFALLIYSTYTDTFKSLSVTNNLRNLFSICQKSSQGSGEKKVVDLSVVDGIKVVGSCFVLHGHVLVFCEQMMSNWREMVPNSIANIAFLWGNLIPAVVVNIFFTMTGLLYSYTSFKSTTLPLVTRPRQWLSYIWNRYLRIMPYYALVVAYTKYLSKYTGSGPFWDYATTKTSPRGYCEQESWLWTVTLLANWKSPFSHCLAAAWYLADDFLYAVLTPIFFQILHWRPKLGQWTLVAVSLLSFILSMFNLLNNQGDMRSVIGFMPHAYKTSLSSFIDNYTNPHYRIPAYLMGILIGYNIYKFEQDHLKARLEGNQKHVWPEFLRNWGQTISLTLLCFHFIFPLTADGTTLSRQTAKYIASFLTPFSYVSFGTSAGIIALLVSTGYANKWLSSFLSSPIFRPLARIALPVLLVNIELITYFQQTSQHMLYSDFKSITGFWLFSIVASYLVGLIFYVLFEAPISSLLSRLSLNTGSPKGQKSK